jgi:hypothetical protein
MQKAVNIFRFLNRLFPGIFVIFTGVMKVFMGQFIQTDIGIEDVKKIDSVEMVFLFYHASGNYVYIIGFTQMLGGLLLLFKKTSIIGALICLTVFINVMLLNYYFHWGLHMVIFMALLNLSFIATLLFEYKRLKNLLVL